MLLVLEVFTELQGIKATVFGILDHYLEQIDVNTEISQNLCEVLNVSYQSYLFRDVERYSEQIEQHFCSTSLPCRCDGEVKTGCGKMSSAIICALLAVSGRVSRNGVKAFLSLN